MTSGKARFPSELFFCQAESVYAVVCQSCKEQDAGYSRQARSRTR